jgi:hypothetical protein
MPSYKARKQIILEALHEITKAANGLWEVAADLEEMKIDPDMLNKAITALELYRDGVAAHIAQNSHAEPQQMPRDVANVLTTEEQFIEDNIGQSLADLVDPF